MSEERLESLAREVQALKRQAYLDRLEVRAVTMALGLLHEDVRRLLVKEDPLKDSGSQGDQDGLADLQGGIK